MNEVEYKEVEFKKVLLYSGYAGALGGLVLLVSRAWLGPAWHLPERQTLEILTILGELPILIFLIALASQAKPLGTLENLAKAVFFLALAQFLLGLGYALFFFIFFSIGLIRA